MIEPTAYTSNPEPQPNQRRRWRGHTHLADLLLNGDVILAIFLLALGPSVGNPNDHRTGDPEGRLGVK